MLCFAGECYAGLASVMGALFGAVLNVTLVRMAGEDFFFFKWHFTILPVFLCAFPLFVVAAAVPAVCSRMIRRVSVVERLRRAEV